MGFRCDACWARVSRTLFLGSSARPRPLPAAWGELGPALRWSEDSLLAVRSATGGDVNPTCRWALSRPLVSGGHGSCRATSLAGYTLDSTRRWPPTSALPAIVASQGHRSESRTPCQERFPFRRSLSRSTTSRNIRARREKPLKYRQAPFQLSTARRKRLKHLILPGAKPGG